MLHKCTPATSRSVPAATQRYSGTNISAASRQQPSDIPAPTSRQISAASRQRPSNVSAAASRQRPRNVPAASRQRRGSVPVPCPRQLPSPSERPGWTGVDNSDTLKRRQHAQNCSESNNSGGTIFWQTHVRPTLLGCILFGESFFCFGLMKYQHFLLC